MEQLFDIGEVARRTGLTLRALRFYEGRGLVHPLRTEGGRRVYGAAELARLNAAVALKRAGFSLKRIGELLDGRSVDLDRLVAAQLVEVEAQSDALAASRTLLLSVQSRIDRGEPIDVATLCSLIKSGESTMEPEHWKTVTDRYFTPAEKQQWAERMADVPAGFDQEAYGKKWKELSARIEAALPLEPMSSEAQAFVDEWFALLKPFSSVATPSMWQGATRLYGDMSAWEGKADPGFSRTVWEFITKATRARLDAGGTVDGPAWMTGARPK